MLMKEIKNDTKEKERQAMFLDWKNHYCQNDYTTQGNLQTQCNFHQITELYFSLELETKKFLICMETQKDPR